MLKPNPKIGEQVRLAKPEEINVDPDKVSEVDLQELEGLIPIYADCELVVRTAKFGMGGWYVTLLKNGQPLEAEVRWAMLISLAAEAAAAAEVAAQDAKRSSVVIPWTPKASPTG
jgi:hypothetical protein